MSAAAFAIELAQSLFCVLPDREGRFGAGVCYWGFHSGRLTLERAFRGRTTWALFDRRLQYRQIQHAAFEFQRRRGITPIDWLLWQLADELFRAAFGTNPRLGQLAATYRRASVQRRLVALERVRARVAAEVSALAAQSRAGELAAPPAHVAPLAQLIAPPRPRQTTLPNVG